MVYLKSVENVVRLGKLIGLLFLFCLLLLSILFLKTKRNDLARPEHELNCHNHTLMLLNNFMEIFLVVEDNNMVHPTIIEAKVGEVVSFTCTSSYDPIWFFNDTNQLPLSYNKEIEIKSITFHNTGWYICYGTYKKDAKHFVASAKLKVYGELLISFISIL